MIIIDDDDGDGGDDVCDSDTLNGMWLVGVFMGMIVTLTSCGWCRNLQW
jgi:hypothetical protein